MNTSDPAKNQNIFYSLTMGSKIQDAPTVKRQRKRKFISKEQHTEKLRIELDGILAEIRRKEIERNIRIKKEQSLKVEQEIQEKKEMRQIKSDRSDLYIKMTKEKSMVYIPQNHSLFDYLKPLNELTKERAEAKS